MPAACEVLRGGAGEERVGAEEQEAHDRERDAHGDERVRPAHAEEAQREREGDEPEGRPSRRRHAAKLVGEQAEGDGARDAAAVEPHRLVPSIRRRQPERLVQVERQPEQQAVADELDGEITGPEAVERRQSKQRAARGARVAGGCSGDRERLRRVRALGGPHRLWRPHQHERAYRDHQRAGDEERRAPAVRGDEPGGEPRRRDAADLVAGAPDAHDLAAVGGCGHAGDDLGRAWPAGRLREPGQREHGHERGRRAERAGERAENARYHEAEADEPSPSDAIADRPADELPDRVGGEVARVDGGEVEARGDALAHDVPLRDAEALAAEVVRRVAEPRQPEGSRATERGRLGGGRQAVRGVGHGADRSGRRARRGEVSVTGDRAPTASPRAKASPRA